MGKNKKMRIQIFKNISIIGIALILVLSTFVLSSETGECDELNPSGTVFISTVDEIVEGNIITISVTFDKEKEEPVENASVIVGWDDNTYLTDNLGKVEITAPMVLENTIYSINASKESYNSDEVNILVLNSPQLIIDAPSSVSEGENFSVVITLSNGTPVKDALISFNGVYFLSSSSGRAKYTAPSVDEDTFYDISVVKDGYLSNGVEILVINIDVTEPQLEIDAPSSVSEGENFSVIITLSDGNPVKDAIVTFNGVSFLSSSSGRAKYIAPFVDEDTSYSITASKVGHTTVVGVIIVTNNDSIVQQDEDGWTYGTVTDNEGNALEYAEVSVILSNINDVVTKQSVLTNNDGTYNISLSPGTYDIEVDKKGYLPVIATNVIVESDSGTLQDFILEAEVETDETKDLTSDIIQNFINSKAGNQLGGMVSISPDTMAVDYYNNALSILPLSSDSYELSFSVSAPDGTSWTVLVFFIGPGVLADLDNVEVIFDDENIPESNDLISFFEPTGEINPAWLRFLTTTGLYVFVRVHHWSVHTITISAIVDAIGGPTAVLLYITTFAILGVIYFAPHFFVRKRR